MFNINPNDHIADEGDERTCVSCGVVFIGWTPYCAACTPYVIDRFLNKFKSKEERVRQKKNERARLIYARAKEYIKNL